MLSLQSPSRSSPLIALGPSAYPNTVVRMDISPRARRYSRGGYDDDRRERFPPRDDRRRYPDSPDDSAWSPSLAAYRPDQSDEADGYVSLAVQCASAGGPSRREAGAVPLVEAEADTLLRTTITTGHHRLCTRASPQFLSRAQGLLQRLTVGHCNRWQVRFGRLSGSPSSPSRRVRISSGRLSRRLRRRAPACSSSVSSKIRVSPIICQSTTADPPFPPRKPPRAGTADEPAVHGHPPLLLRLVPRIPERCLERRRL